MECGQYATSNCWLCLGHRTPHDTLFVPTQFLLILKKSDFLCLTWRRQKTSSIHWFNSSCRPLSRTLTLSLKFCPNTNACCAICSFFSQFSSSEVLLDSFFWGSFS